MHYYMPTWCPMIRSNSVQFKHIYHQSTTAALRPLYCKLKTPSPKNSSSFTICLHNCSFILSWLLLMCRKERKGTERRLRNVSVWETVCKERWTDWQLTGWLLAAVTDSVRWDAVTITMTNSTPWILFDPQFQKAEAYPTPWYMIWAHPVSYHMTHVIIFRSKHCL